MSSNRRNTNRRNTGGKQSGKPVSRHKPCPAYELNAAELPQEICFESALSICQSAGADSGLYAGARMDVPLLGALPEDSTFEDIFEFEEAISQPQSHKQLRWAFLLNALCVLDVDFPNLLELAGSKGRRTVLSEEGQRMYIMEHCFTASFAVAMRYKLALEAALAKLDAIRACIATS